MRKKRAKTGGARLTSRTCTKEWGEKYQKCPIKNLKKKTQFNFLLQ